MAKEVQKTTTDAAGEDARKESPDMITKVIAIAVVIFLISGTAASCGTNIHSFTHKVDEYTASEEFQNSADSLGNVLREVAGQAKELISGAAQSEEDAGTGDN